mgnify:CR=1 FL=1
MSVTLLLQARTNSSRLPAKVLLPVAGMPLVVLAARRAANTGHRIIVVTSCEPSDDVLCKVLEDWGIACFRGELKDVLKRFVDALDGLPDSHVVVRLTADNVLPDGRFIDRLLDDFERRNVALLACGGKSSGLPYGVSAEVTRVGYLRKAHREATSLYDREHVTSKIIAENGRSIFEAYRSWNLSQYRCTVDTLSDYLLIARLFAVITNPDQIFMDDLLEGLKSVSTEIVTSAPAERMVLGTAQFGLNYGITNTTGRPNQGMVDALVRVAVTNGVQFLDTARAYNDSENRIGKALSDGYLSRVTLVTKLSPLDDCPVDASSDVVRAFVERSVYQSCRALGVGSIDVLMLHRASHLAMRGGSIWDAVCRLQEENIVQDLGVSVQSPEEALAALDFDKISFIQIPFNIIDNRWDGVIQKVSEIRQRRSLVVHARSALLQGLLSTNNKSLWERACCFDPVPVISWLERRAAEYAGGSVVDLCLQYVFSQHWISGVVVGVDSMEQLVSNLKVAGMPPLSANQLAAVLEGRPVVSRETLDPAKWKQVDG